MKFLSIAEFGRVATAALAAMLLLACSTTSGSPAGATATAIEMTTQEHNESGNSTQAAVADDSPAAAAADEYTEAEANTLTDGDVPVPATSSTTSDAGEAAGGAAPPDDGPPSAGSAQRAGDDSATPESARVTPTACTYSSYNWSTEEGRAVNRRTTDKDYADVTDDERSPEDPRCSVCTEDQVEIDLTEFGIEEDAIQVCWAYADNLRRALRVIVDSGEFDFTEVTGYRPGRTRGRIVDGLRTEWSNHSFGTAIDINANRNGLYRSCNVDVVTPESIEGCRLGIGGEWDPELRPRESITSDGVVYRAMTTEVGWQWGGEIEGRTKDLMHFSITGF